MNFELKTNVSDISSVNIDTAHRPKIFTDILLNNWVCGSNAIGDETQKITCVIIIAFLAE
jgi:hypothetical protein